MITEHEPLLYTNKIRGLRLWRLHHQYNSGNLIPILQGRHGSIWPSSQMEAECTNLPCAHTSPTPVADCMCGIYGCWSLEDLRRRSDCIERDFFIGIIEAWGKILIGPYGFRAQHAKILALLLPKVPEVILRFQDCIWRYKDSTKFYITDQIYEDFPIIRPELQEKVDDMR